MIRISTLDLFVTSDFRFKVLSICKSSTSYELRKVMLPQDKINLLDLSLRFKLLVISMRY